MDIEEQARVMGANQLQIFFRILLPLAIPGLVAAAIYTFLLSWDEFIFAHFLLDPGGKILTLTLYLKQKLTFQPPQNLLAAISVCLSMPVIIFTLVVQKQMVSGIHMGSVK
jgi:multiple sugar transport system permease protein